MQVDLRLADLRARGGDTIGAGHLQLVAAAEGIAVHGGDDRRPRAPDPCEHLLRPEHELLHVGGLCEGAELADVGPRHEHRAGAGEDGGAQTRLGVESVQRALQVVEGGPADGVGRRHVDGDQRDPIGPHGIEAHRHRRAVDEARAPGLVDLPRGAGAVERRRRTHAARDRPRVPVLVDRLVRLREGLPRLDGRRVDGERPAVEEADDLGGLMRVRQMAAEDREAGEHDALAVHPDVRRVEGQPLPRSALEVDDAARVRAGEKGAEAQRVLPRALDDDVRVAARIVRAGEHAAYRLAEGLEGLVLIGAISVGIHVVVGHRLRPAKARAPRHRLQAHHATGSQ